MLKKRTTTKPTGVTERRNLVAKPAASSEEKITMKGAGKKLGLAELPSSFSEPATTLGQLVIAIHGEKKIGKTSLSKRFENAFFLFFEPGGKGFKNCGRLMLSWEMFLDYISLLEKEREYAKTIVIDTIDKAYEMCFKHVCIRDGFTHPSDESYGKGWAAIKTEFNTAMDRILKLDRGIIFLSHTESKEFLRRSGGSSHKLVPTMAGAARDYITGIADIIAYYGYYGEERYLTIDGSDYIDAGHRLENNFLTTSGEKVHSIHMGNSADEAFKNFMDAFNNQQKDRNEPEDATGLEKRAPMGTGRRKG